VKLIVGLGNPGSEYRGTRHNVGFAVVDEVARRWGLTFRTGPANAVQAVALRVPGAREPSVLAKPETFMNRSGFAVGALQRYYRVELHDLLVITEDVNLPLGRLRVRRQGSAGGHNGLRSVIEVMATDHFPRLRVGVGRGDPRQRLTSRVLSRFAPDERELIDASVRRAAEAVDLFAGTDVSVVMNLFNRNEPSEPVNDSDED